MFDRWKDTQWLKKAFGGQYDAVKAALDAGGVPDASSSDEDIQLLNGMIARNFDAAKAALEAGADANGSSGQPLTPIMVATIASHAGIVELLLEQGADPDRPLTREIPCPIRAAMSSALLKAMSGERALHVAAKSGDLEIVRLLLKRSLADPDATDDTGCTPLMAICSSPDVCMEVVQLLLEAGADPTLAQEKGYTPMHRATFHGRTDLVDMLYSRAPSTLNRCAYDGVTPFFTACAGRHEGMVSKLLSLGATQLPPDGCGHMPLGMATKNGLVSIVQILITDKRIRAVGGDITLGNSLYAAVCTRQAVILRLLLTVHGEERRSRWANIKLDGRSLLHYGAGWCNHAEVSILLEAGADEAACDSEGRIPRDVIGVDIVRDDTHQMDRGKEVAIRQMLQRGPAYRARSWAWSSDEGADAGDSGGGDTAAAGAVLSSRLVVKNHLAIGVQIFWPKENSSGGKLFVRIVGRYCAKD